MPETVLETIEKSIYFYALQNSIGMFESFRRGYASPEPDVSYSSAESAQRGLADVGQDYRVVRIKKTIKHEILAMDAEAPAPQENV